LRGKLTLGVGDGSEFDPALAPAGNGRVIAAYVRYDPAVDVQAYRAHYALASLGTDCQACSVDAAVVDAGVAVDAGRSPSPDARSAADAGQAAVDAGSLPSPDARVVADAGQAAVDAGSLPNPDAPRPGDAGSVAVDASVPPSRPEPSGFFSCQVAVGGQADGLAPLLVAAMMLLVRRRRFR
jgi:MYXO-CTERM domain-containing protein